MLDLRANTQVIVPIGPFLDVTDGFTPEVGITLSAADEAELLKHGSTTVVSISAATWAAITSMDGYYGLTLTTSHTDTEGQLTVVVQDDSICLPVKMHFRVLSEAAYNSLYTAKDAGFMDMNVKTVGRTDAQETEANNFEAACAAYSATRGLTGTALPAAAAEAAGGVFTRGTGAGQVNQDANGRLDANMAAVSQDSGAADALETMLDGTGGNTLTLNKLRIDANDASGGIHVTNSGGDATLFFSTGNNGDGFVCGGNGTGSGLAAVGGATGPGVNYIGGATSGNAIESSITSGTHLSSGIDGEINAACDTAISDAALATAGPLATVDTIVNTIVGHTAEIGAAGAGLSNITLANDFSATMKTSILAQINAALDTAIAELAVATPSATPSIRTGIMLGYMALRNKLRAQTSGTDALEIHNSAGTKIIGKLLTDDGSDYEEAKMA